MKVAELEQQANVDYLEEASYQIKQLLISKKKEIKAAQKVVKELESAYEKLLEQDVEDVDLNEYEY